MRKMIQTAWRRYLGFLAELYPDDLLKTPADRITPDRVRSLVEHLSPHTSITSVAIVIDNLFYAARLIAPAADWRWLWGLKARLRARAMPKDRFEQLVPPWQTFDFGIELMDNALGLPSRHKQREIQYRNGLIIALLSLWPLRRRSIAALTESRHLELDEDGITILLYSEDTKSKRAESFRLPDLRTSTATELSPARHL